MELDRLSHLPNSVQALILSLLSTKEAIQTSSLSRQWRHTYYSLSKFDFMQFGNSKEAEDFRHCVGNTLLKHDETDIESFTILVKVNGECITNLDISSWITLLVKHNIQNLHLMVDSKRPIGLPTVLFTCHSLNSLKLDMVRLRVPAGIQFPTLKSLVIQGVKFEVRDVSDSDEDEEDYDGDIVSNKLFSTCPALEMLEVYYCDSVTSIAIFNPSLKYLKVTTRNDSKFNLCIPSLQELIYRGDVGVDISKDTLSSLHAATIEIYGKHGDPCFDDASAILSALRNIETLTLELSFIKLLSWDPIFESNCQMLLSPRLKHLHLDILPTKDHIYVVKFLTSSFPLLQTLRICASYITPEPDAQYYDEEFRDNKWHVKCVSTSKLRTVELKGFQERDCEVELISYLLATSTVLEIMNISYAEKSRSNDNTRFVDEVLFGLPRVSAHVALSIC